MIPKTHRALERDYANCARHKTFIQIDKQSYADYRDEALADLASAKKEDDVRWAIVKAYQALFHQCTAVLVKNLGVYSKDHGCLITALLKHNIISRETLEKVHSLLDHKKTLFEEIDAIRLSRNKALYFPKTHSKIGQEETTKVLEDVRQLIVILGEQL
ncbi:HEPN domain-containing protein [Candidatus Woesearchaeota archaeon]|nr:HEPN domain-containing protein [Candidatus Woesearchaeota archaeon]